MLYTPYCLRRKILFLKRGQSAIVSFKDLPLFPHPHQTDQQNPWAVSCRSLTQQTGGSGHSLPSSFMVLQKNNPTKLTTILLNAPTCESLSKNDCCESLTFTKATFQDTVQCREDKQTLRALPSPITLQFSQSFGSDSCSNNSVSVWHATILQLNLTRCSDNTQDKHERSTDTRSSL